MLTTAFCAICSVWIYDRGVNPGHPYSSTIWLSVAALLASVLWVRIVFPFMGQRRIFDIALIAMAFPIVGGLTGLFALLGNPIGFVGGMVAALNLPLVKPVATIPIYAIGIIAAFVLPRLKLP